MKQSSGILVLGMHRSGTSALARVLNLGGADLGARVLGASAGNEAGHWEDAFAVETHERILASFGTRWSEPFALPADIAETEPVRTASARILDYLVGDRAFHRAWAVKDPRLCLFAGLWQEAAAQARLGAGAVVVLRHPIEIAGSLEVRDGIGMGHSLLLWLESMASAVEAAERMPHAVIAYDALLEDWRSVVAAITDRIEGTGLDWSGPVAGEVDAFLDRGLRHHRAADAGALPTAVGDVWERLSAATRGGLPQGTAAWIRERVQPLRELLHPYAEEERASQRVLWERVGRAEARALDASADTTTLTGEIAELRERTDRHRNDLVELLSSDIRRMQEMVAEATREAGRAEGRAVAAEASHQESIGTLAPRLDGFASQLEQAVADVRARAGQDTGALGELGERVDQLGRRLIEAYSADIRRMQDVAAEALAQVEAARTESSIAAYVAPRLERIGSIATAEAGELRARIDRHGEALVELFSTEIRRMQEVATDAIARASASEREARIASDVLPRLDQVFQGERELQAVVLQGREDVLSGLRAGQEIMRAEGVEMRGAVDRIREDVLAGVRDEAAALAAQFAREQDLRREIADVQAQLAHLRSESDHQRAVNAELNETRSQLQREIALLRQEAVGLRERSDTLDRVVRSYSWRATRPLRVVGRLLTGRWTRDDSSKLRRIFRTSVHRAPLLPEHAKGQLIGSTLQGRGGSPADLPGADLALLIRLAPQLAGAADVFVWSVIDWRFRTQRPQHLARALAEKGHRVFYISNNFVDSIEPGFRIDPLDDDGRLFQLHLHLEGAPAIYFDMPTSAQVEALRASLATVLAWSCTVSSISLVQHPYWSPLVRAVPNGRVVYDCMDHHAGFLDNAPAVLEAERRLVRDSDLVIVTSDWLDTEIRPQARATALIRNAGEFEFFRKRPAEVFRDAEGRRVIGYYGAIAEWFDADLVRAVAEAFPESLVLLVGNDTAGVGERLADLPNVRMTGEVPYADLPFWLYGFDVCLLPFRVIPLTLATNPVKVYEYLSAGMPVVSVDLPEMRQFGDLVHVAGDALTFVDAVRRVLDAGPDMEAAARRQAFAAEQTWAHRAAALDTVLASIEDPKVSVIVLTYNNLAFTEACLFSLEAYSDYANLEVIVVDNASRDGSREWLARWAADSSAAGHVRRLILNDENLGFSAGNNVGLRAATGDYIVILNNDTYVTPGWVRTLCAHFRTDAGLGLIGPATNNIGNEARVEIHYEDMVDMIQRATEYTRAHPGGRYPLKTAAFFCVAMPRTTYERVGDMDEAFGVGFFEDDDYCRRVEAAGLSIACADDVFVHHHLSASFDKLRQEKKQELFERNKAIYEAKWGPWVPHAYRR